MVNVDKMGFVQRCILLLTKPSEFFKEKFTEELRTPVIHMVLAGLIGIVLNVLVSLAPYQPLSALAVNDTLDAFVRLIFTFVEVVLLSFVSYFLVRLMGRKSNLEKTIKVFAYANTVRIFSIALSPLSNFALLYWLYVLFVAYRKQEGLDTKKAAIATLVMFPVFVVSREVELFIFYRIIDLLTLLLSILVILLVYFAIFVGILPPPLASLYHG